MKPFESFFQLLEQAYLLQHRCRVSNVQTKKAQFELVVALRSQNTKVLARAFRYVGIIKFQIQYCICLLILPKISCLCFCPVSISNFSRVFFVSLPKEWSLHASVSSTLDANRLYNFSLARLKNSCMSVVTAFIQIFRKYRMPVVTNNSESIK